MFESLAESLELSLRERNDLLIAAGYPPVFSESRLDDEAVLAVRDALDRILIGHFPEWGRHIIESLRAKALRSPSERLDGFIGEESRPACPSKWDRDAGRVGPLAPVAGRLEVRSMSA